MKLAVTPSSAVGARPQWLFATLWSLRKYPTVRREWTWERKFSAIRAAGFDGVFSPPIPAIAERGTLRYLAVPELGNAAPAYGLSCFGDTWRDACAVARDLRQQWRSAGRAIAS